MSFWTRRARCRAVLTKQESDEFYGRCDLDAGHQGDHELERGFFRIRWATVLQP